MTQTSKTADGKRKSKTLHVIFYLQNLVFPVSLPVLSFLGSFFPFFVISCLIFFSFLGFFFTSNWS